MNVNVEFAELTRFGDFLLSRRFARGNTEDYRLLLAEDDRIDGISHPMMERVRCRSSTVSAFLPSMATIMSPFFMPARSVASSPPRYRSDPHFAKTFGLFTGAEVCQFEELAHFYIALFSGCG